jgi:hypothetical protein
MQSSAMPVLPALVGSETTRSSDWSTARAAASTWDGHRSTSALGRLCSSAMNSSRRRGQSAAGPPVGWRGTLSWKVFDQRSPTRWMATRCVHHCGSMCNSPQIERPVRSRSNA